MMKRSFISILLSASLFALSCSEKETSVPAAQPDPQPGESYLLQLQPRDSVLIADQLRYGFLLEDVPEGVMPEPLPAQTEKLLPGIRRVSDWQLDTLPGRKGYDIYLTLTSFDAGSYDLPPIGAVVDGDTLLFEGRTLEVFNCPVDTTKFTPENINIPPTDIVRFPWTAKEWWTLIAIIAGSLLGAALLLLLLWRLYRIKREQWVAAPKDPAHIRALRKIDSYRSNSYWAPEKQKGFYSGITDALKEYIGERYQFDAPEMTSGEVLHTLKKETDLPKELRDGLGHLFEVADYVKFAKHTAPDEENAAVVPFATNFVTATYQQQLEEEQSKKL